MWSLQIVVLDAAGIGSPLFATTAESVFGRTRHVGCDHSVMTLEIIRTVATLAVPIVVAVLGYLLNRRLKKHDASQWRNQELIKARLQYFGELAPMLNDLMCYMTFIGRWKEMTPPDVLAVKRNTDRLFYSVAPLFSQEAADAYKEFLDLCFSPYGKWGTDARIRSGYGRRRSAAGETWRREWDAMFTHTEGSPVDQDSLKKVRDVYNRVLAQFVGDIKLIEPRPGYASADVTINAH